MPWLKDFEKFVVTKEDFYVVRAGSMFMQSDMPDPAKDGSIKSFKIEESADKNVPDKHGRHGRKKASSDHEEKSVKSPMRSPSIEALMLQIKYEEQLLESHKKRKKIKRHTMNRMVFSTAPQ